MLIRSAQKKDETVWHQLWQRYCKFYNVDLPLEVSRSTWERILDATTPVNCLLAIDKDDRTIGFANYVVHPYTWSSHSACYLEDLFVDDNQRGKGVGKLLIESLLKMCGEQGWTRLYWHTDESNQRARRIYDQFCLRDNRVRYSIEIASNSNPAVR